MLLLNLNYLKLFKNTLLNLFGFLYLIINLPFLIFSNIFPKFLNRSGIFFGGIPFKSSGGPEKKLYLLKTSFGEKLLNFKFIYLISGSLKIPFYLIKIYKFFGIKIIINQNGVFYPAWYKKGDLKIRNRNLKQYNDISDFIIFQSKFALKSYSKFVGEINKKYEIIYNAVSFEDFYPLKDKSSNKDFIKVLIAGNFYNKSEDYRVINAINAIEILFNDNVPIKLYIAGKIRTELFNKIKEKDYRFLEVLGPFKYKNANDIFNMADIYLHLGTMGCCDNILLEMMASGKEIVALNNGGNSEILSSNFSLLIPCPNNWYERVYPNEIIISEYIKILINRKKINKKEIVDYARSRFSIREWILKHKQIINTI